MTHIDIERKMSIDLDIISSFDWSHGKVDRSIYNSLSEYQEVRRREFIHLLAVKWGLKK